MGITSVSLVIMPIVMMFALASVISMNDPVVQSHLDTMTCTDPGQTSYEQTTGRYNWNATSGTKLHDCSDVITIGNPGGCGQSPPSGCDYFYGSPTVQIGWFFYVGDVLNRELEKASATSAFIGAIMNPPSFTLLGQPVDTSTITIMFSGLSVIAVIGGVAVARGV